MPMFLNAEKRKAYHYRILGLNVGDEVAVIVRRGAWADEEVYKGVVTRMTTPSLWVQPEHSLNLKEVSIVRETGEPYRRTTNRIHIDAWSDEYAERARWRFLKREMGPILTHSEGERLFSAMPLDTAEMVASAFRRARHEREQKAKEA